MIGTNKDKFLQAKEYEILINLSQKEYKWTVYNTIGDGNCCFRSIAASLPYEQFNGSGFIEDPLMAKEDYYNTIKTCMFIDYMGKKDNMINIINLLNNKYTDRFGGLITEDFLSNLINRLLGDCEFCDEMDIVSVIASQTFKCNITIWSIDHKGSLSLLMYHKYSDSDTNTDINLLYVNIETVSRSKRNFVKTTVGHYLAMFKKTNNVVS